MLKCTFLGRWGEKGERQVVGKLLLISEKGGMFILRGQAKQDRLCSEASADLIVLVEFHVLQLEQSFGVCVCVFRFEWNPAIWTRSK